MTSPVPSVRFSRPLLRAMALLLLCVATLPVSGAAQSLWMPRSVKRAVAQGTRTLDGRPGPRYWQNHGRYTMTITVMPPDRRVSGTEGITYWNESPDTLPGLVIKLFQNYHEPGAARGAGTTESFLTSGVHIDGFEVDGKAAPWTALRFPSTEQAARLPHPLLPGDSVHLAFKWHYDVSLRSGREGMVDSTTYFLAYFYPRVAVYDDVSGWDTMEHTGHEFYSDFNDYDVSVQVPPGFVVWGTGHLEDPGDVLTPEYLKRFQASLTSDETVHVATREDMAHGGVTRDNPLNVWRFTAHDVPDVAFGLSDHYDWDAASVVVDPATGRRASTQAAYADSAADFHHMVHFAQGALSWLSANWPGVPYPYEKTTVFQGGAGMEYPMMANDGSYADTAMSRLVAEHEIAHTYMPFYMGTDETRYAFMDEGWATTFEYLIEVAKRGKAEEDQFYRRFRVNRWIHDLSSAAEIPIITPSDALTGVAYGDNAYGKASLGYLAMKDLLGDAMFRKCLHAYMDRWHGKHPSPWDFFYTFDNVAGRSLDWFWSNWFFGNGYIDLAVDGVHKTRGGYTVDIGNVGGMDAPVDVVLRYRDGSTRTVHETPEIWKADSRKATVSIRTGKTLASLMLYGGIWMDADTSNNTWTAR
jgi:hypothetical protein